jgi:endonuclease/exonuclease/phosphatase family metal-dependent hydrolase
VRIVAWNMGQKGRKTRDFMLKLEPDIALLQEAILPEEIPGYSVASTKAWEGKAWASTILSRYEDLDVDWEDRDRGAVLLAHCTIPSIGTVSMASVHARVIDRRVIPALRATFAELRSRLGNRFVVGGDFNTARLLGTAYPEQYGHAEFWREIDAWAFDCYYKLHGTEKQSFWREGLRNELMDDHILVDAETFKYVKECVVLDTKDVRQLSDHGPVLVDLTLPEA